MVLDIAAVFLQEIPTPPRYGIEAHPSKLVEDEPRPPEPGEFVVAFRIEFG
jgi:hypothetical protein